MEPGPTAEPRRLNTSLLRLLKVECTLGEPKSLGLTWNRRDMYIRNGMHCNNTGSRCSYMSSQNVSLDMLIIRETTNCQFEKNETGSLKVSGPQREELFSGVPTMQDSNLPTQLQRLARMLKF